MFDSISINILDYIKTLIWVDKIETTFAFYICEKEEPLENEDEYDFYIRNNFLTNECFENFIK